MKKLLIGLTAAAINCACLVSYGQANDPLNTRGPGAISVRIPAGTTVEQVVTGLGDAGILTTGLVGLKLLAALANGGGSSNAANAGATVAAVTTSTEQGPSGMSG